MKMIMVVVPKEQSDEVISQLVAEGHTATLVESKGGALRQTSQLMFIVVDDNDLEHILDTIGGSCRSDVSVMETEAESGLLQPAGHRAPQVGGAVVFVWTLDESRKL